MASQAAVGILDPQVLFEQAPERQGRKVDRPDAAVNLLEADGLPNAGDARGDPPPVPPDPAVGTHVAGLKVPGIRERGRRRGSGRGEGLLGLPAPCVAAALGITQMPVLRGIARGLEPERLARDVLR